MNAQEFFWYFLLLVFRPRSTKTMEWRMLRFLNRDRRIHGLSPVRMQEDLRSVARKHSRDMAEKDYFDHVNLKAQSPADRLRLGGISEVVSGENLAMIGGYPNATQHAEIGLMNSPGHRANILNPVYNCVGIGVVQSTRKVYYFTQNFAKRDLVLKSRVPSSVNLTRGLRLRGEFFSQVNVLYLEIFFWGQSQPLFQQRHDIQGRMFDLTVQFPERGLYGIKIYCGTSHDDRFVLVNSLKVKVRKGFWW